MILKYRFINLLIFQNCFFFFTIASAFSKTFSFVFAIFSTSSAKFLPIFACCCVCLFYVHVCLFSFFVFFTLTFLLFIAWFITLASLADPPMGGGGGGGGGGGIPIYSCLFVICSFMFFIHVCFMFILVCFLVYSCFSVHVSLFFFKQQTSRKWRE